MESRQVLHIMDSKDRRVIELKGQLELGPHF